MTSIDLVMYAVGDIILGDTPLCYGHGVGSHIKKNGPAYPFERIRDLFPDADMLLGNLEAPISPVSNQKGLWRDFFRADPSVIGALKEARFTALSVANNHSRDHGEQAFNDTIDLLLRAGIQPVGYRKEGEVIMIKGIQIGILARTLVPDLHHNQEPDSIDFMADIVKEIQHLKNSMDLVIVYLHWGAEYVPCPSPEQVKIGRSLVDAGVDIVLGSHPHVLQGYEIYNDKLIFYSLGNFIADGFQQVTHQSCIVRIEIQESCSPVNVSIIPVTIDPTQYRPVLSKGQEKDEIVAHFQKVRTLLENKTSEEYSTRIGPYSLLIKINSRHGLTQMKIYFLKNLYRYPPRLILDLIWHFIKKFIKNISIRKVTISH